MARWNYTVYKHTAPNGKVYIGITCKTTTARWNNGNGYKKNTHFFNAIQKYGWEHIQHEVLYTGLTKEEAEQKEIELIAEYKSNDEKYGYNKSTGGECGATGCHRSRETRAKMSKAKKANGGKSLALEEVLNHLNDIEKWARNGASEADIATRFGITRQTFWKYKNDNNDIFNAIKKGRMNLVDELKGKLAEKAKGFYYTETKTTQRKEGGKSVVVVEKYEKYAQPDTGAIHLLLKNLDPEWRNDDQATMDLKREQLEIAKQKADENNW